MRLFGLDGCRGGWVAASSESVDEEPRIEVFGRFGAFVEAVQAAAGLAVVDIPIGLADGPRECDRLARRILGRPRSCSVFTPPSRKALRGTTKAERRALNLACTGHSLSEQTLNIADKIDEVDAVMTPSLQATIREGHPELIFAASSGLGTGLRHPKKTREGRRERLRLLPRAFAAAASRMSLAGLPAAPDDVVDALAALTAAFALATGTARTLPGDGEEHDERGLRMEMVY